MTSLVVIPARWGSRRFPGKPLADIAGRPLLARVIDVARRALRGVADGGVMVATDDERIAAFARSLECEVAMTSASLASGTDRVAAAIASRSDPVSFVVNLQGDAPFLPAEAVTAVVTTLSDGASVATPVVRLSWRALDALRDHKRAAPFSGTTCIRAENGDAFWFSKQVIPAIRDEPKRRAESDVSPVFRHVGLYGYRPDALARFVAAAPSRYERLEGLEQLRFLDLGIAIRTVEVDPAAISMGGIDTPDDVILAERLIAEHGDPFGR